MKYAAHNLFWALPLNFFNLNFTFVSPAMGATLQTFLDRRVLMIELFPTLG